MIVLHLQIALGYLAGYEAASLSLGQSFAEGMSGTVGTTLDATCHQAFLRNFYALRR